MNKNQISLQVYTSRNFKPYENIFKFLSKNGLKNLEIQLTEEEVNWLNLKNLNNK